MSNDGGSFRGYVGDEDIHDGQIASIVREGSNLIVCIKSGGWKRKQGQLFKVVFSNASSVQESNPLGRLLYALCEKKNAGLARHFHFAAEDDESCLDIYAESLDVDED